MDFEHMANQLADKWAEGCTPSEAWQELYTENPDGASALAYILDEMRSLDPEKLIQAKNRLSFMLMEGMNPDAAWEIMCENTPPDILVALHVSLSVFGAFKRRQNSPKR